MPGAEPIPQKMQARGCRRRYLRAPIRGESLTDGQPGRSGHTAQPAVHRRLGDDLSSASGPPGSSRQHHPPALSVRRTGTPAGIIPCRGVPQTGHASTRSVISAPQHPQNAAIASLPMISLLDERRRRNGAAGAPIFIEQPPLLRIIPGSLRRPACVCGKTGRAAARPE